MNGTSRKYEADYVNLEYGQRNGKRYLASIGETKLLPNPDTPVRNKTSSLDRIDGTTAHVPKYNYRKVQQFPTFFGSKTRKMQCQPNRTDSDSSPASGIGDYDEKTKELEHYNKLKLNLSQLQQNKKALKGVKLLYDAEQGLSHDGTPHVRRLFREKRDSGATRTSYGSPQHTCMPSNQFNGHAKELQKYTKEGHGNRLHSVTGKAVNRATSFLWSMNPIRRSHSTGDLNNITPEPQDHHHHHHVRHYKQSTQRSHSFCEAESTKVLITEFQQQNLAQHKPNADRTKRTNKHHTAFSPEATKSRPHHLAESTSRFKRRSLSGDYTAKQQSYIRNSFSFSSEANSQHEFSPSHSTFHDRNNQVLQVSHSSPMHNGACPQPCSCSGISFIDPTVNISVDSNGAEYTSNSLDISIFVPKGTIKKNSVELHIGVTMHGEFEFPDNRRPVSPIVWISTTPEVKLKKPIEITLPHFIDLSQRYAEKEPNAGLVFMRASHKCRSGPNRRHQFQKVSENSRWISNNHATLQTKQFGFLCIVGNTPKLKAHYCLLPVIPRNVTEPAWRFHYCITYLLKTCITVSAIKCNSSIISKQTILLNRHVNTIVQNSSLTIDGCWHRTKIPQETQFNSCV